MPSGANSAVVQSIFYILKASNLIKVNYLEASTALLQLANALMNDTSVTEGDLAMFKQEVDKLTFSDYDIDSNQH